LWMRRELLAERLLSRTGDELAFRKLTDPFRRELQLHCYRWRVLRCADLRLKPEDENHVRESRS
jgi:hypothetical protein